MNDLKFETLDYIKLLNELYIVVVLVAGWIFLFCFFDKYTIDLLHRSYSFRLMLTGGVIYTAKSIFEIVVDLLRKKNKLLIYDNKIELTVDSRKLKYSDIDTVYFVSMYTMHSRLNLMSPWKIVVAVLTFIPIGIVIYPQFFLSLILAKSLFYLSSPTVLKNKRLVLSDYFYDCVLLIDSKNNNFVPILYSSYLDLEHDFIPIEVQNRVKNATRKIFFLPGFNK